MCHTEGFMGTFGNSGVHSPPYSGMQLDLNSLFFLEGHPQIV